ncbi:dephospho-CoA kinase [Mesomycoplasma hyorhinis]|uniref:dephospho-CoA kinase n=1 Tax=Mesomycoplasma hyorhinis TaxID=2100 RepID=UPI0002D69651
MENKHKTYAVIGKYAVGKTTFLNLLQEYSKKVLKKEQKILFSDEFFQMCYLKDNPCYLALKNYNPAFVKEMKVNKEKLREFIRSNPDNINIIEKLVYPFLEEHLKNNKYDFVEIPNLYSKNANFAVYFDKVIRVFSSEEQRVKNIVNKNVNNSISSLNDFLNKGFCHKVDVNISNSEWKNEDFFPKFFSELNKNL